MPAKDNQKRHYLASNNRLNSDRPYDMVVANRSDVGIGVFNAKAGFKVRLGGAAVRAVGADCGRRSARLYLFATLRKGSGGHANPSWWRDQPRRTGPTRPCRISGAPDSPGQ